MLETGRVLKAMCVATAFGRDNCKILKLNFVGLKRFPAVDTIDTVEGVCNGFLPYTRFLGFPEFSGYHQWQQELQ